MSNTLTPVVDKLLATGLLALREAAFMPLVVNRGYDNMAGEKGSTVDVPIPSAVTAVDVTPAATPPSTSDVTLTSVSVPMDQWKEAPFYLTDKERMEIVETSFFPMQASEAIKSLANVVNTYIFSKMRLGTFGYAGTAGTTPFASDTSGATAVRKVLTKQLAPTDPRYIVIDPDAEANALGLRAFQDASFGGGADALLRGQIGEKLGFRWLTHQLVPTHTAGTITTGLIAKAATAQAVGDQTIVCTTAASTGACALLAGDIITFAGHTQTYVLTAAATQASAATDVTLNIYPGLQTALAGSEAVSVKATHVCNLAFHRDAFAFATRPLAGSSHPGSIIRSVSDAESGLTLRLEITREHKRDRYSYDILYGGAMVRPELAARLAG